MLPASPMEWLTSTYFKWVLRSGRGASTPNGNHCRVAWDQIGNSTFTMFMYVWLWNTVPVAGHQSIHDRVWRTQFGAFWRVSFGYGNFISPVSIISKVWNGKQTQRHPNLPTLDKSFSSQSFEINTCQNIILKKICFGGTLEATNIKLFVDGLQAQFLFDWDRFVLGSESRSWAVCANALKSTLAFVVFSDILGILAPVKCHKCHLRQPRNVVLDAKWAAWNKQSIRVLWIIVFDMREPARISNKFLEVV